MKLFKGMGQSGDTLVEVLICILIVSMILTGAYVTTNKSTVRVIDSQERAEALKLAQAQLEQIRQHSKKPAPNVLNQPASSTFCMVSTVITPATDARCKQDRNGDPTTEEPIFGIVVDRRNCPGATLPANCSLFTIKIDWTSIATKTPAYAQMTYRLYP
jgi:prepilin-type N-terminal cleavage/methylation domain-containing protein